MIQLVTLEQVLPLRIEILRNGSPEPPARNPEDDLENTFHVAYFENEQIIGIATFHPISLKEYQGEGYQLRGMAVHPSYQKKGIGKQILLFGENELKKRKVNYVWCNAREKAFPFYEKMGYQYISEIFEIPYIGPHKKMYKNL